MEEIYHKDDGFTTVRREHGARTTPIQAAIPTEVSTPPVTRRNKFGPFKDDLSSERSNPADTITTPSLERVLVDFPPPDTTDSVFTDHIVDSLHQTAHVANDTI